MSTSGTDTYAFTARNCITFALRKLGIVAQTATPTATQAQNALVDLNLMLKAWMKYENLWRIEQESVTPVANTASYTLTSQKPHRIVASRWRNTSGTDLPMTLMTREEYFDLPVKTATGLPTMYYVDYQRAVPVLYIWPVPSSVTTETIQLTSFRRFEDVTSLDEDIDIRQEHFEGVAYNLAKRLGIDAGRVGTERYRAVVEFAEKWREEFLDEDREDEIRFVVGYD